MTATLHVPQNCLFQIAVLFDTKQTRMLVNRGEKNEEFSA